MPRVFVGQLGGQGERRRGDGRGHDNLESHWKVFFVFCFFTQNERRISESVVQISYWDPRPKMRQEEEEWVGRNIYKVYILLYKLDSI